jgi:hypothetical protein
MTAHIDWTQLHEPLPHLVLEESLGGYFTAIDQSGRIFYPPTADMNKVIRFMRALALRGDVTLDEGSITWFRALRQFGEFSVKAGTLSERGSVPPDRDGLGTWGPDPDAMPRSESVSMIGREPLAANTPAVTQATNPGEPASLPASVAGGVGANGEPKPGANGDAAAPRSPSPPHLFLVRGDAA